MGLSTKFGKEVPFRNLREKRPETGLLLQKGSFKYDHLLEILENTETQEILESPQSVENKGKSNHFLEIAENLEF